MITCVSLSLRDDFLVMCYPYGYWDIHLSLGKNEFNERFMILNSKILIAVFCGYRYYE